MNTIVLIYELFYNDISYICNHTANYQVNLIVVNQTYNNTNTDGQIYQQIEFKPLQYLIPVENNYHEELVLISNQFIMI